MTWSIAPVFRVRNVRASAAFYRDRLVFDCPEERIMGGVGDEGAVYAIARRDGIEIHLGRQRTGWTLDAGKPPNALGAYFFVADVDALHAELRKRGAPVDAPSVASYGLREIHVVDPDGYHLGFGCRS